MNQSDSDITARPSDGAYWANVPTAELGAQVRGRYLEYLRELDMRKAISVWKRTAQTYYGYDPSTGALSDWVTTAGEQGQFLALHVNEFASLVRHQLILTTAEQIEFDCIPTSDSPHAEAQAALGEQVIRYYQGEGKLDATMVQGVERMLLFGAGYVVQLWDAFKGPEVGVEDAPRYGDDGEPLVERIEVQMPAPEMEPGAEWNDPPMQVQTQTVERPVTEERVRRGGDITHRVYSPMDIARDLGARTHEDCHWYIVRERWDRFEAIARYPEHKHTLLEAPAYDRDESARYERGTVSSTAVTRSDQIHIYRLLHDRSEVVPMGMEALVCGDTVIQPPQPLAYARLPIHPMVSSEHLDTPLGHTNNVDLLGPQGALNAAAINGLTAMDAGSRPVWAIPRGSNVDVSDMSRGIVQYTANAQMPDAGMPKLLQQPELRDAHIKGMELWTSKMQSISGVNSVVRGESQGKSGADNALLQAQAVQYQSGNVRALAMAARSLGLGIVEILQRFATDERMVRIVGEDEAPSLMYFKGQDLSDIRHVEVDLGDPAMRTFAMRKTIASELLERFPGQVTPDQYLAFMSSGRLEPLYKSQRNQVRLIAAENASMAKGQPVPVLIADQHLEHIREHVALLASPNLRQDQTLAQVVLTHCQEHEELWAQLAMRPALLAATGQPPPPPPPGMPGMGMPMPGGPQDGAPPPGPGGPPGGPPAGPPEGPGAPRARLAGAPEEVAGVPLPQMPKGMAPDGQPMGGMV
jgi:hypothetical protein